MSVSRLHPDAAPVAELLPSIEAVDALDVEALPGFLAGLAALQSAVAARMALGVRPAPAPLADDLLTARAAASLLSMSEDWIRRHGEREGLAVRVGARAVKYSRRKITQYLHRRSGRLG